MCLQQAVQYLDNLVNPKTVIQFNFSDVVGEYMPCIKESVRINEKKAVIREEVFQASFDPRGIIFKLHNKCRKLNILPWKN